MEIQLKNGISYSALIPNKKLRNSSIKHLLNAGRDFKPPGVNCFVKSDIKAVSLVAGGSDGWFVSSIVTQLKSTGFPPLTLTSDPLLNKFIDNDEEYKFLYNAKHVSLTLQKSRPTPDNDCITWFKLSVRTGSVGEDPGFNPINMYGNTYFLQLVLYNDETLSAPIDGPAISGRLYTQEMYFNEEFNPSMECISKYDIKEVNLLAGGSDEWFVQSIATYIRIGIGDYEILTEDESVNSWIHEQRDNVVYDQGIEHRRPLTLTKLEIEDTPKCGYGVPVCECNENATTCIFNLEIEEIMSFSSYKKFEINSTEGLYIRGAQGVLYSINNETGEPQPHPAYSSRDCAKKENTDQCSSPQFVDGKTYRMIIAVNGQVPGPTIIVSHGQKIIINVHNNMSTEGTSIHWHGMFQQGTPWMDGVGQVTQCQIGPSSTYTYMYIANPSGTFWYHSHSGAQRTDGLYGALIVKEEPKHFEIIKTRLNKDFLIGEFNDFPSMHTMTLLDWHHKASLANFVPLHAGLGFFPDVEDGEVPPNNYERYSSTYTFDGSEVGPMPYFSGLINGKGRHPDVDYSKTKLSVFEVENGKSYRFRLIGAQGLYAYKFSIDGHKLRVVGTDGYWIEPELVDYIIIHSGERYDFILDANNTIGNYWITAETLEVKIDSDSPPPYKSLGHVAEAILHYHNPDQNSQDIKAYMYESIKNNSTKRMCSLNKCKAINCPFENFHSSYHIDCINVHQLKLLLQTPDTEMPDTMPCAGNGCQHFINFNFEGDSETSSVNGRNLVLPPVPPLTQSKDFETQGIQCDLNASCNPFSLDCTCTHIVDTPANRTVQFVLSALGVYDNAHPIHLHGHAFHVLHIGYPPYDNKTGLIKKKIVNENGEENEVSCHNDDITCDDLQLCNNSNSECMKHRCTMPRWTSAYGPIMTINNQTIRKDTVIVPAGGYVVINYLSDNPGYWFLHCHIEVHQMEGMALVVNEASDTIRIPSVNKCGNVEINSAEYFRLRTVNSDSLL